MRRKRGAVNAGHILLVIVNLPRVKSPAFGALLGPGIVFGDLYIHHARRESWWVEDGIVIYGAPAI